VSRARQRWGLLDHLNPSFEVGEASLQPIDVVMEHTDFARTSEPHNLPIQRGHSVPYVRHISLDTG
jgi:hypothetical protein